MPNDYKNNSWDFYSKLIIIIFSFLQILRWRIFPQFLDSYYHLLTASGFLQAGGYSGWDFWQYAPVGRIHIYPPLFHIILAFLIKSGIPKIILAKFFETVVPIIFLVTLRYFITKNYNIRLSFFVLVTAISSFSFYLSLINNLPATIAIVIAFLSIDQLFRKKFLRPVILLTLCFYTHIGISWLFFLAIILYGFFDREYRKLAFSIAILAIILSLPIILRQVSALKVISLEGITEKYFSEFKTIDYLFALIALLFIFKKQKKYLLFLSLFLASFIFVTYPYRFFSAQGFLPIIILSAICLDYLYEKFRSKRVYLKWFFCLTVIYFVIFSPTLLMEKSRENDRGSKIGYKMYFADSAFTNMMFPDRNKRISATSLWFPNEYLQAAEIIKQNTKSYDIIYSEFHSVSVCLAALSDCLSANGLLPEVDASRSFNPFEVSNIIIAIKGDDSSKIQKDILRYNLVKIGENKLFVIYKNPAISTKAAINKADVSFGFILLICGIFSLLFWQAQRIDRIIYKKGRLL